MGRTIIEKLERESELPGYAFILLTPDDIGCERDQSINIEQFAYSDQKLKDLNINFRYRARQNVIFELGYFLGLLGRERVCYLYKGDLELPSDISGIAYKRFTNRISEIAWEIRKELKAAGYDMP
jgi:predicted nucleotide-binding protein